MSDIKISRKFDNNRVQVVVSNKKSARYYSVPTDKADSFCNNYKKHEKNIQLVSTLAFVGATLLGCASASYFTQKFSKVVRSTASILGGIVCGLGATYGIYAPLQNKHQDFLDAYNAMEIHYGEGKLPF